MLSLVHSIFMTKSLAMSVATYLKLVESVDTKIDKLISKEYESAIGMLEQTRHISNPTICSNLLVKVVDRFNQAIKLEKRERLLFSYLGLMVSYYYLGEKDAVSYIQQQISKVQFSRSFWEKYGGDIENAGVTLLGVVIACVGGGNPAIGGTIANKTGESMKKDAENSAYQREIAFNQLRDEIARLKFPDEKSKNSIEKI